MSISTNKRGAVGAILIAWGVVILMALAVGLARGGDLTPGYTWVNGEQVTASKMNTFMNDARIKSAFFTARSALIYPLGTEQFLVWDANAGSFKYITVSGLLTRTNLISDLMEATTLGTNGEFMVNLNGDLSRINTTNLARSFSPYLNLTNWTDWETLTTWGIPDPTSTNNQPFFLVWGTNGTPKQVAFSNLLSGAVPDLGTNRLVPYIYQWTWNPLLYSTNTNRFAITNLLLDTNGTLALSTNDALPLKSVSQGSNTTVTLDALYQYFTNRNALPELPTYTLARATFNGVVNSAVLSNAVDTSAEYVYAINTLAAGDAVTMVNSVAPANLPAATPALTTNQIYWVKPVNGTTLQLFTNRTHALAGTNFINITGAGTSVSTLLSITKHSSLNLDVTAVTAGVASVDGLYDLWFQTPTTTTNYYVLGSMQKNATYYGYLGVSSNFNPGTNKLRVATVRVDNTLNEYPRVQVSIQPE